MNDLKSQNKNDGKKAPKNHFIEEPVPVLVLNYGDALASIWRKAIKACQTVLNNIPECDREVLLKPTLRIMLAKTIPLEGVFTACANGDSIWLNLEWVEFLSQERLVHTIAHEFGHVVSERRSWRLGHKCTPHPKYGQCAACELMANAYLAAWGFDPELMPLGE